MKTPSTCWSNPTPYRVMKDLDRFCRDGTPPRGSKVLPTETGWEVRCEDGNTYEVTKGSRTTWTRVS